MSLRKGAKIEKKAKREHTPLHFAAFDCELEAVQKLVELGADKSAINSEENTPLNLAKDPDIISFLEEEERKKEEEESDERRLTADHAGCNEEILIRTQLGVEAAGF